LKWSNNVINFGYIFQNYPSKDFNASYPKTKNPLDLAKKALSGPNLPQLAKKRL